MAFKIKLDRVSETTHKITLTIDNTNDNKDTLEYIFVVLNMYSEAERQQTFHQEVFIANLWDFAGSENSDMGNSWLYRYLTQFRVVGSYEAEAICEAMDKTMFDNCPQTPDP